MTPAAAADQRIGQRQREEDEQKQAQKPAAAAPKRQLSRAEQQEEAVRAWIQGTIARNRARPEYAAEEEERQRQRQRQALRHGPRLGM